MQFIGVKKISFSIEKPKYSLYTQCKCYKKKFQATKKHKPLCFDFFASLKIAIELIHTKYVVYI